MKLKYTQVREYRLQQLSAQSNCCALCGELIIDDAVLDHDHKTGLVRAVLHRGCNALLGKVENNLARNAMSKIRLAAWAGKLVDYIEHSSTDILHPTHLTQEERHEKLARKRIKNRKKQKATKAA